VSTILTAHREVLRAEARCRGAEEALAAAREARLAALLEAGYRPVFRQVDNARPSGERLVVEDRAGRTLELHEAVEQASRPTGVA
jgi:hypothetical protein